MCVVLSIISQEWMHCQYTDYVKVLIFPDFVDISPDVSPISYIIFPDFK